MPGSIDPRALLVADPPRDGSTHLTTAPPADVSRAALYGGTTTLIDFAVWNPAIPSTNPLRGGIRTGLANVIATLPIT